ncbi:GNAT family N-acetyltransferase [soil metagenome]
MAGFTIERSSVPLSLDPADPAAAAFIAGLDVRNASEARAYGTQEVVATAAEVLPNWLDEHAPKVLWLARVDGVVVGRAIHETQVGEGSDVGWIDIDMHPSFERRGIGTALADAVEQYARELGQSRLISYAAHPDAPGPRIESPTGFGSVPADNREVRFSLARGYRLEQIERASRFALPPDRRDLTDRRAEAQAAAGPDYAVHTWVGRTPPEWLADLAVLHTRMSTDAPSAGLEEPEDVWTVERLATYEQNHEAGAALIVTAAAEHVPTGRLVAFTQLEVPRAEGRALFQSDTLVLREHRGHRLGMLLKVANLEKVDDAYPGRPSVLTWNAEENRYMLGVNEAVGFVPIGYEGAWRLDL